MTSLCCCVFGAINKSKTSTTAERMSLTIVRVPSTNVEKKQEKKQQNDGHKLACDKRRRRLIVIKDNTRTSIEFRSKCDRMGEHSLIVSQRRAATARPILILDALERDPERGPCNKYDNIFIVSCEL